MSFSSSWAARHTTLQHFVGPSPCELSAHADTAAAISLFVRGIRSSDARYFLSRSLRPPLTRFDYNAVGQLGHASIRRDARLRSDDDYVQSAQDVSLLLDICMVAAGGLHM